MVLSVIRNITVMKEFMKGLANFFKKEWFLFVAVGTIALLIFLFQLL